MKYYVLRCFAYALEAFIFFFVQQTPNLNICVFGVKPIFLIPICITVAMFEKDSLAIVFGTLCGVLMDFGFLGTIGVNSFLLPVLCYLLNLLCVNVIRVNILTAALTSMFLVFIVLGLHFIFYYLLQGYEYALYVFVNKYLPRMLYTWLLVPFFYLFNKSFSLHIKSKD